MSSSYVVALLFAIIASAFAYPATSLKSKDNLLAHSRIVRAALPDPAPHHHKHLIDGLGVYGRVKVGHEHHHGRHGYGGYGGYEGQGGQGGFVEHGGYGGYDGYPVSGGGNSYAQSSANSAAFNTPFGSASFSNANANAGSSGFGR